MFTYKKTPYKIFALDPKFCCLTREPNDHINKFKYPLEDSAPTLVIRSW